LLKNAIQYYFSLFFLIISVDLFSLSPRVNIWEKTDAIWNFGLVAACDKGMELSPISYFEVDPPLFNPSKYDNIQSGDIVWVQCRFLGRFYREVFPKIENPFVLIITDGDESFPSNSDLSEENLETFLNSELLIHLFAQNCDYDGNSEKVSHLPIGMDFHTIAYKGADGGWGEKGSPLHQEANLKEICSSFLPTYARKLGAFIDFQLSDSMHGSFKRYLQFGEDRTSIFNRLLKTGLFEYSGFLRRTELWKKKGEYAFSISPHGNGLDCHRTWEDLILGCIVIVKSSSLDPLYEDLPVIIVDDWSEITKENLQLWLTRFPDAFTNPFYREKLTHAYWIRQIKQKAFPYKINPDDFSE